MIYRSTLKCTPYSCHRFLQNVLTPWLGNRRRISSYRSIIDSNVCFLAGVCFFKSTCTEATLLVMNCAQVWPPELHIWKKKSSNATHLIPNLFLQNAQTSRQFSYHSNRRVGCKAVSVHIVLFRGLLEMLLEHWLHHCMRILTAMVCVGSSASSW